ncbi:MAG TPA: ferric reductase-like transmembrane domain-containing protein [Gemmatimonadaceae bacterium]|nr:ferric reductase-like transmembrane domain-containing protein [Gemmatimonadaceae bacterium]
MSRITLTFWGLCALLTILWLAADPVIFGSHPLAQVQNSFINYTGIVAMGTMAVSLLLALRSVRLEPHVGGLDKSYRLHKWLGVAALGMVLAHWLWINTPSWLAAAGVIAPPPRRSRGAPSGPALLHTLQGPARGIGSWCFYAAVILLVLALVKWFPYRRFIQTHRLLAIVYLPLVFHSVVLLKTSYWKQPIAYLIAALMAAGTVAAIYILFRRVGRTRQAVGQIERITEHQDGRIVAVTICLKDRWPGHDAGQFAFVKFDGEEPHPFTISSGWKDDGLMTFVIKGLGDYTAALPTRLQPGSLVTVEGPYGRFNFGGNERRQIWVSAGIGITPFISRMQHLAMHPDGKVVDLFHATGAGDVRINADLWRLVHAAKVNLHVWVSPEQGLLTADHICRAVPEWKEAAFWFCGPVDFGKTLREDLTNAGLPKQAFHQELFHFR